MLLIIPHPFLWGLPCFVGLVGGIALVLARIFQGQAELIPHFQMLSPLYDLDAWTAHLLD